MILSGLVFLAFGSVGTFLVVFAANTLHWEAYDNWNLGWLVPTHLLLGIGMIFLNRSGRSLVRAYLGIALVEIAPVCRRVALVAATVSSCHLSPGDFARLAERH